MCSLEDVSDQAAALGLLHLVSLKWLGNQGQPMTNGVDHNIEIMTDVLMKVRDQLKFGRGGAYIVKQGRGRIVIEPAFVEKT